MHRVHGLMEQLGLSLARPTRADQILEKFLEFHAANPLVWDLFQRFTFEALRRGRARYSADMVVQRIRWHVDVETANGEVKINNNFPPYYARMFHAKYPQHAGLFETRHRISEDRDAYEHDIQVFDAGPASNEERLLARLRAVA